MDCTWCFHHLVYYFIVFFTPESTFNDGQECRSIQWPMKKKKKGCSFLTMLHEKSQVICHWFFTALPEITLAPPQSLIPLGERRKRGQLHLWLLNKCITVWVLCPGLSGPLTWNVPMRQSGAIGAWQLAAGRDNLLRDMEQRAAKDFVAPVNTSLKPWDMPIQKRRERERESFVTHWRAVSLNSFLSKSDVCRFIV